MDKNALVSRLNKIIPGGVLETRRFGRSENTSIWIEAQAVQKIAMALKMDTEMKLDWLENLSVVEFEKVFIVTYFLRSLITRHSLVIRASAVPVSPGSEFLFPSVRNIWPMGLPMEEEAEEMFGIVFSLNNETQFQVKVNRLPENWKGFPLRKDYVFPSQFEDITHSRSFNKSNQKKSSL